MEISQVGGRVRSPAIMCIADMAGFGGACHAGLKAVLFRLPQAARIARLDMDIEGGVLERRDAPLRSASIVVAGDVCFVGTTLYDAQN